MVRASVIISLKRRTLLVAAILFGVTLSGMASSEGASSPTFNADIAPIVNAKCVTCHQEHGDAPFPLETFDQVRRRASQIVQVINSGYMPPWKPAADSLAMAGDRRLSSEQKSLVGRWVQSGMPEGRPTAVRQTNKVGDGWLWGTPDLVVTLPEYVLAAGSGDVFRNFVVAVPFEGTRQVRGLQFRPRNRAVHHANIRIDPTPASADLDAADPEPGYEGVILHSADYPEGHFLGWTPGQSPPPESELAWPLVGKTWLVVQLHMRATGRAERIQPVLGLYFSQRPAPNTPSMIRLGRQNLRIGPGEKHFETVDSFVTPVPATVMAIQPHAHYRARDVRVTAEWPDGTERTLLHISDWDFNWQDQYRLAQPLRVPAGTTFKSVFSFDNSEENPRNPSRPPETVEWGWRSADEMADVWLQALTDNTKNQRTLTISARDKATREDAIGTEVLVAREPDHYNLRNDAASIYLELHQPQKALEHFLAARRLKPEAPSAAYNVGIALEMLGRRDEALDTYRAALAIDYAYAPAHIRIGAIRYQSGRTQDAIAEYKKGLQLAPGLVRARCELGRMLTETNQPSEAINEFRLAVSTDPHDATCLINYTWLLAASDRADITNPSLAVEIGRRAVDAGVDQASQALALDALAAAFAASNRFDDAIASATRALALAEDAAQRNGLIERLSLYRRRLPFVVKSPGADQR